MDIRNINQAKLLIADLEAAQKQLNCLRNAQLSRIIVAFCNADGDIETRDTFVLTPEDYQALVNVRVQKIDNINKQIATL